MKTVFKVGDRVWDGVKGLGWGTIEGIITDSNEIYPIMVYFDCYELISYTLDGKMHENDPHPSLSFTEYDLVKGGFSQERPEMLPERGDIVWVRDNEDEVWKIVHFIQKIQNGPYYFECSDYANLVDRDTYKFMTTKNPYKND